VVIARLWLLISGLLISGVWLWIGSGLEVAVAGLVIDGLNSVWIGIADGLRAIGALLLLLQLELHFEELDFLLLLDEGQISGRTYRLLLLSLLAAVDDVSDESTAESDELGLCGVPAVSACLF
jgi:hypothetical protein